MNAEDSNMDVWITWSSTTTTSLEFFRSYLMVNQYREQRVKHCVWRHRSMNPIRPLGLVRKHWKNWRGRL